MTTAAVVLLAVAYAAVAALLLYLLSSGRGGMVPKMAVIIVVSGLYIGTWFGYRDMTGWATPEPLPRDFRLLWVNIDEPPKSSGRDGYIYYWIRELDVAGIAKGPPRAHRIAWSELAAQTAEQALTALESGDQLNGRLSRNLLSEGSPERQDSAGVDYAGQESVSGTGGGEIGIKFVVVPPPTLPAKAAR
ncbi:MAG: hypothetical protein O2780_19055 [Proteobacteria bacterium]|nr:hypothetical protein [Pseudomonadota bacterium]